MLRRIPLIQGTVQDTVESVKTENLQNTIQTVSLETIELPFKFKILSGFQRQNVSPEQEYALRHLMFFIYVSAKSAAYSPLILINPWVVFFKSLGTNIEANQLIQKHAVSFDSCWQKYKTASSIDDCLKKKDPSNPLVPPALKNALDFILLDVVSQSGTRKFTPSVNLILGFLYELEQKFLPMIDVTKIAQYLSQHPVIANFTSDLFDPALKASVQIIQPQINYIIQSLKNFIESVWHSQFGIELFPTTWKGYSRYIQKSYLVDTDGYRLDMIDPNFRGGRSFLLFTKKHEPGKFYILLKANIKIPRLGEPEGAKDILWASGSLKQVKLYSLLLTFCSDQTGNIVPDFHSPVKKIITFSRPTTKIAKKFGVHDPNIEKHFSRNLIEDRKHQKMKSDLMFRLLHDPHYESEYADWDGVLSFTDMRTNEKRMLGYLQSAGKNFDAYGSEVKNWNYQGKLFAIFSLLKDLKRIVCEEQMWPTDIKFSNTCFEESTVYPGFYNLKFIDYTSRMLTYSFINSGAFARQSLHDAWERLDRRMLPNGQRFKLLTCHLCFELILIIFHIFNLNGSEDVRFCSELFNHQLAWLPRPDQENQVEAKYRRSKTELLFFSMIIDFAYVQDSIWALETSELLKKFFVDVRNQIKDKMAQLSLTNIQDYSILVDGHVDQVLSNAWIETVVNGLFAILTAPPKLKTPKIEMLTAI